MYQPPAGIMINTGTYFCDWTEDGDLLVNYIDGDQWRLGVVDATAIRHASRVTASAYDREDALDELRGFLRDREWIDRNTANSVIETHRTW